MAVPTVQAKGELQVNATGSFLCGHLPEGMYTSLSRLERGPETPDQSLGSYQFCFLWGHLSGTEPIKQSMPSPQPFRGVLVFFMFLHPCPLCRCSAKINFLYPAIFYSLSERAPNKECLLSCHPQGLPDQGHATPPVA